MSFNGAAGLKVRVKERVSAQMTCELVHAGLLQPPFLPLLGLLPYITVFYRYIRGPKHL